MNTEKEKLFLKDNGYDKNVTILREDVEQLLAKYKATFFSSNASSIDSLLPSDLIALKDYYDKKWKWSVGCRSKEQADAENISKNIEKRLADMAGNLK